MSFAGGVRFRKVDRNRPRVAKLLGQLIEPVLAPRGEHQAVAALRTAGERTRPQARPRRR